MQRRFEVVVGALAIGLAGMFGVGPSAMAAETADMGDPAAFTVYENNDFNGGTKIFLGSDDNLTNDGWDGQEGRIINDNISSVKNTTNRDVSLYDHVGCTGEHYLSRKKSEDSKLSNNGFNDRASCVRFD